MRDARLTSRAYLAAEVDEARLLENLRGVRRRQARLQVRRVRVKAGLVSVAICALLFGVLGQGAVRNGGRPGPLVSASQGTFGASEPVHGVLQPGMVALDDGSRITVGGEGLLTLVENSGQRVHGILHQGWARFDVEPGGPRRWLVDVGPLRNEVVGTSFTVSRSLQQARVRVHHGRVLVRGARAGDEVVLLGAGEELSLPTAPASGQAQPDAKPTAVVPELVAPTNPAPATGAAAHPETSSADVLVRADRLRAAHRPRQAARLLEKAWRAHPDAREAGLVALTLAQLQLDQLAQPALASRTFARALRARGLPEELREQCMARRVQALVRAGSMPEASRAAEDYLRLYPSGAWAAAVRSWASVPGSADP